MTNSQVASVFQEIAGLLEPTKENIFKIRAYERAARAIETCERDLRQLMEEGRLKQIPGIGDAIAKKITELLTTGRLGYLEKLRSQSKEKVGPGKP